MNSTKELYAQFRQATRKHDDMEAYRLLREICLTAPDDKTAASQMKAIGQRMAGNAILKLDELCRSGDTEMLRVKMRELKEWADEDFLCRQISYVNACEYLKKHAPMNPQTGNSTAKTAELYKQFRAAGIRHDDETAFEILEKIIACDSSDTSAVAQKKETGKRLCKKMQGELSAAYQSGNKERMIALVGKFRSWGDPAFLNTIRDYKEAAALVDAEARAKAKEVMAGLITTLESQEDRSPKKREELACSVEELSVRHNIELKEEMQALLSKIHKEWHNEQHRISQIDKANDAAERLQIIQSDYELHKPLKDKNLEDHVHTLGDLKDKASTLCDVEEGQRIFDEICTWKSRFEGQLARRRHKRAVIRRLSSIATLILLATGGTALYAHSKADSMAQELSQLRTHKDVTAMRDKLTKGRIVSFFCKKFNSMYRIQFQDSSDWLSRYDLLLNKLTGHLADIKARTSKITLESMPEDVRAYWNYESVVAELVESYNFSIPNSQILCEKEFIQALKSHREPALAKYKMPPVGSNLSQLAKLYAEYKECRNILEFKEDENMLVKEGFHNQVRKILLRDGTHMSSVDIDASLQMYEEYVERLELPKDIQERLEQLKREGEGLAGIEQDLLRCTTLTDFAAQLRRYPESYKRVKNAFKLDDVANISKALPALARIQAARNLRVDEARFFSQETLLALFDIFNSGSNAYGITTTDDRNKFAVIDNYIDKISCEHFQLNKKRKPKVERASSVDHDEENDDTDEDDIEDDENEVEDDPEPAQESPRIQRWRRALKHRLYCWNNGNTVYVGSISRIGNTKYINTTYPGGRKESFRVTDNGEDPYRIKLDVALLESMGYERIQLQNGCKLPVDLLQNVSSNHDSRCPVMLRAYLYATTVEMMEHFPVPEASGILLSPTLQADIQLCHDLSQKHHADFYSWRYNHPLEKEEAWRKFFTQVGSHRYKEEILTNLNILINSYLDLVGFASPDGSAKLNPSAADKPVYYIEYDVKQEDYKINKFTAGAAAPYTPLFILKVRPTK